MKAKTKSYNVYCWKIHEKLKNTLHGWVPGGCTKGEATIGHQRQASPRWSSKGCWWRPSSAARSQSGFYYSSFPVFWNRKSVRREITSMGGRQNDVDHAMSSCPKNPSSSPSFFTVSDIVPLKWTCNSSPAKKEVIPLLLFLRKYQMSHLRQKFSKRTLSTRNIP